MPHSFHRVALWIDPDGKRGATAKTDSNSKGVKMTHDPASKMVELRFTFQAIQDRKAAEDAQASAAKQAAPKEPAKKSGYRF